MTLAELLRKAQAINNQFNSAEIPIMHGDQECWFDLEVEPPRGAARLQECEGRGADLYPPAPCRGVYPNRGVALPICRWQSEHPDRRAGDGIQVAVCPHRCEEPEQDGAGLHILREPVPLSAKARSPEGLVQARASWEDAGVALRHGRDRRPRKERKVGL